MITLHAFDDVVPQIKVPEVIQAGESIEARYLIKAQDLKRRRSWESENMRPTGETIGDKDWVLDEVDALSRRRGLSNSMREEQRHRALVLP